MFVNEFDLQFNSAARGEQTVYFWLCISSPGIANEMGGITLIPISMNLGQPCKMEAQAPCHPQVNQAQEAHLSSASKPKKTGSLALFYRKVGVLGSRAWPLLLAMLKLAYLCGFRYRSVFM